MIKRLKGVILHKLTLRVGYIVAAFATARVVAFSSSDIVQSTLTNAGITFKVHDPEALKLWISGIVLLAGEFVYHWIHTKFILPKVRRPNS